MILHYFKNKENKDKEIADFIYVNIINCSKNILNSKLNEINKGLNISFEISSIILISIFIGSKKRNLKDWKNINQELMNIFTRDLDHSMRLSGISDMNIGKYVKGYVKKFYFRIKKFEKIYQKNDFILFNKYFLSLKLLSDNNNMEILENIFIDLKILSKRSQILKNERLLFEGLFK